MVVRYLLVVVFFLGMSVQVFACKCKLFTIEQGFKKSELVFYAKHLGTTTEGNAIGLDGEKMAFELFQVKKVFKGPSGLLKEGVATLSLLSSRNQACGFSFDSGKVYLVYAELNYQTMQVQVSQCSRTRELRNDFFVISNTGDPDDGHDEYKDLTRLANADTSLFSVKGGNLFEEKMELMMKEREALKKEVKKRTSMTIILSTSVLILVIYVLFDFLKKRKA
ncbi:MAG: hypothetical protein L6Q78_15540 [Bacteroidia bacterium]|nr:hypothetical protein [Bacteroidia bacterium]